MRAGVSIALRVRRALPLPLALAMAMALALALVPAAGRAAQSHRAFVPCPLSAHGAGAGPSCCGPPVAEPGASTPCCAGAAQPICCPPNADCAPPLSISATPDPGVAGEAVRISGRAAAALRGDRVTLWQRVAGGRRFSAVQAALIAGSGAFSFHPAAVDTNRLWYVTAGGARSATLKERVRLRIRQTSATAACGRGSLSLTLRGSVFPAQPGRALWLLGRRAHGRWRVLARAPLGDGRRFTLTHRWRAPASVALRLYFPGDRRDAPARSATSSASCA